MSIPTQQTNRPQQTQAQDISGYSIFCESDVGEAHVMAHRLLDEGRLKEGRDRLEKWLAGRTGEGSRWVHLQFHMAVFEIETGDWHAAYRRFTEHILPTASTSTEALTDAPQLLWRLALTAPEGTELPWEPVHDTALSQINSQSDLFVEMHNMMALAGSGDLENLFDWACRQRGVDATRQVMFIHRFVVALMAYIQGRHEQAQKILSGLVSRITDVGGSRAQNELFELIEHSCAIHRQTA